VENGWEKKGGVIRRSLSNQIGGVEALAEKLGGDTNGFKKTTSSGLGESPGNGQKVCGAKIKHDIVK